MHENPVYQLTFDQIQGDQVSEDTPISIPYTHNVAINETRMVFGTLYEFEGEIAPNYSNQVGKRRFSRSLGYIYACLHQVQI